MRDTRLRVHFTVGGERLERAVVLPGDTPVAAAHDAVFKKLMEEFGAHDLRVTGVQLYPQGAET